MLVANALCWFCHDTAHIFKAGPVLQFFPSGKKIDNDKHSVE
jgi:hypothetical protein